MNQLDLDKALIKAVKENRLDKVRELIDQGANPENNSLGPDEPNAVEWAGFYGLVEIIRFFLEELEIRDYDNCILSCALEYRYGKVMEYLSSIEHKC